MSRQQPKEGHRERTRTRREHAPLNVEAADEAPNGVLLAVRRSGPTHSMHQGLGAPWCTNTSSRHSRHHHRNGSRARRQHETKVDTEAGMLSGVSRKRSIRSNPCWFTEFCKSQCLSHFAAPFIVVRAETSVAESCKEALTKWRLPPRGEL